MTAPVVTVEMRHAEASMVERQCAERMDAISVVSDAGVKMRASYSANIPVLTTASEEVLRR